MDRRERMSRSGNRRFAEAFLTVVGVVGEDRRRRRTERERGEVPGRASSPKAEARSAKAERLRTAAGAEPSASEVKCRRGGHRARKPRRAAPKAERLRTAPARTERERGEVPGAGIEPARPLRDPGF